MINAGELDRRITLRSVTTTTDASNSLVETWADLCTIWCKKTDVKDAEKVAAAQVGATITTRFVIRYSSRWSTINPTWRLTFEGREYAIEAVKQIGRDEGFELSATARAE